MMRAIAVFVGMIVLLLTLSEASGDRFAALAMATDDASLRGLAEPRRGNLLLASSSAPMQATEQPSEPPAPTLAGRALAFAQPESVWDQEWQKVRARIDATDLVDLVFLTRGERGGEEQILHDLRRGRAHMGGMSLQGLASTVPELNIAMSPFIFSSIEEIDFVYDNYLFDVFDELFAEKNLQLLQWVEVGWNGIYAQKAIRLPADAEGLRLRGSPNPAAQLFLDAIGADSIPLGSGDLVPSLQTGLINGGVSAVIFHYFVTRRYASHVALLNHSYDTGAIVVNRDWYNSATPEQQEILRTSWGSAADARVAVRSLIDKAISGMAAEGIVLVEPTDAELEQWRSATAHIPQALIERIGGKSQEVFDAIEAGKAAFRAQQASRESKQDGDRVAALAMTENHGPRCDNTSIRQGNGDEPQARDEAHKAAFRAQQTTCVSGPEGDRRATLAMTEKHSPHRDTTSIRQRKGGERYARDEACGVVGIVQNFRHCEQTRGVVGKVQYFRHCEEAPGVVGIVQNFRHCDEAPGVVGIVPNFRHCEEARGVVGIVPNSRHCEEARSVDAAISASASATLVSSWGVQP